MVYVWRGRTIMSTLEFKKNRENFEITLNHSKGSKSFYRNVIDKDYNKLAQILIDLYLEGYPIEKAFKIMKDRIHKRDWIGF